jgi:hypothetical protein
VEGVNRTTAFGSIPSSTLPAAVSNIHHAIRKSCFRFAETHVTSDVPTEIGHTGTGARA